MLRVQARRIAEDDALALQAADALRAGGGRQPDPLTQLGEGEAAFGLEDAQDMAVDLVQFAASLMAGSHG